MYFAKHELQKTFAEKFNEEISTEKICTKLLEDLPLLNLNRVEHVSPDVVLCAGNMNS